MIGSFAGSRVQQAKPLQARSGRTQVQVTARAVQKGCGFMATKAGMTTCEYLVAD